MVTSKRRRIVMALDVIAVLAAYCMAFLLHHDFKPRPDMTARLLATAPYPVLAYVAASYYFGVNRGLRFCASLGDLFDILKAVFVAALASSAVILILQDHFFPRSVLVTTTIFTAFSVAAIHGFARAVSHYLYIHLLGAGKRRDVVIVGVGDLAELLYDTMRSDQALDYRIVAFCDEDPAKFGVRLHGARIVDMAGLNGLLQRRHVDEIVIAVERGERARALDRIADVLRGTEDRPAVLVAPGVDEMLTASKRAEPRRVRPEDLLNRRVISLDASRIERSIEGKVVLISGAGGTIGGELARQVALRKPKRVILFESNATALFYIESELRERHPGLEVSATLGDVRDAPLVDRVFRDNAPQIVFHAAAHKHVHQLETNVAEGVSNNLLGTYRLARAADRIGSETFILISTDKAVRPTCVMGATKRAAEIVVSNYARTSKTRFASVRFGNVLGSSGSVMRIFQEQIEKGQPLTLTHPEATRFFMTVQEAVGLVLQASCLARGGEVFVLNMGEQIRIVDMARRLIWLSGLEPERDVPFRIVGLRPGEKLAEEIMEDPLGHEPSEHPDIMVLRSENREVKELAERIMRIELLTSAPEKEAMMRALVQLVPTFTGGAGSDGVRVSPIDDQLHDQSSN
jgi:FlaA1/EpsC-like NDP-sugar epimerase